MAVCHAMEQTYLLASRKADREFDGGKANAHVGAPLRAVENVQPFSASVWPLSFSWHGSLPTGRQLDLRLQYIPDSYSRTPFHFVKLGERKKLALQTKVSCREEI